MYWRKRFKRKNPDQNLEKEILKIRKQHKDYGYRRMTAELSKRGFCINKKKVQRLIQKLGLQVVSYKQKYRRYNSYRGKVGVIATNRVRRRFYTNVCHQKITTDTSEFKYFESDSKGVIREKKLYLDPFMDMFNNEIISYRISDRPTAAAVTDALDEAIEKTSDCPYRRTFHSDRGWAYQMKTYTSKLNEHKIFQSMSRKGNCLDNSPIENFFGILKQEIYHGVIYRGFEELRAAIEKFIHYYNHDRIKQKLNWLSPVDFREKNSPVYLH